MLLGGYGLRTVLRADLKRGDTAEVVKLDRESLPSLDVVVAARAMRRLWSRAWWSG